MQLERRLCVWLLSPLLTAVVTVPVSAETGTAPLRLRVYGLPGISDTVADIAHRTALDALRTAGITIDWTSCERADGLPAACGTRLTSSEVAVRLVRTGRPAEEARALPLGYSLIDIRQQRGTLATVDLDRVEWLAAAAGADAGTLLGRAVAHEVGHLLLGTTEHAETGVMRARWSSQSLQRDTDWRFTPPQAARMRVALETRRAEGGVTTLASR